MNRLNIEEEEEENNTKSAPGMWYQWLEYRLRYYMVLEGIIIIILFFSLSNYHDLASRNMELNGKLEIQIDNLGKRLDEIYELLKTNSVPKPEKNEILKNIREESIRPAEVKTNEKFIEKTNSFPITSLNYSRFEMNAANILMGASVDLSLSSSSVSSEDGFFNNFFYPFTRDQSGYILLDREELPPNKSWCSEEKQPVLTINLAKNTEVLYVSYQHSKWNGLIPDGAPKKYNVLACLDSKCKYLEPLETNCKYEKSVNGQDIQEQFCRISSDSVAPPVRKVQFHFLENHGNVKKTCIYSVRVFGIRRNLFRTELKKLQDKKKCEELAWNHKHSSLVYSWQEKNCTLLYSMECCSDCPECCSECKMEDFNYMFFGETTLALIFLLISILAVIWVVREMLKNLKANSVNV
ncbi:hypothetical protein CRE_10915 [Caenorhabditis remanei]|uniref:SUN domain-containing protein n=1 Tax=Caenorhabditis remanei TaxID=31234 RepID=E3M5H9_CAERE|nr:hypothetical protein CRE_10915 [Caenorhabditis remanei]